MALCDLTYDGGVIQRAQPSVRIATIDDRDAVVATVVAAFANDPAFRFFFPDVDRYELQATRFVQYLFDKRVSHRTVWTTANCEAVALWSPPGNDPHAAPSHDVARMQAALHEAIGGEASNRLHLYDNAVRGSMPESEPYWYLGVLGADPAYHGQGFGFAVMRAGMAHAQLHNGVSYLETTNPNNVAYYQRNGWEITNTIEPVSDEMPLTVWIFRTTPTG
jgi:ribosomal protein S18 acetylase RimI-like enzyme